MGQRLSLEGLQMKQSVHQKIHYSHKFRNKNVARLDHWRCYDELHDAISPATCIATKM